MRNSIQYFENPPIYRPAPSLVFKTWVQSLGREDLLEKGQAIHSSILGFPGGSAGKESACYMGALGSIPGLGRYPWRRDRLPTPVFWPGEFHRVAKSWTQLKTFTFHFDGIKTTSGKEERMVNESNIGYDLEIPLK